MFSNLLNFARSGVPHLLIVEIGTFVLTTRSLLLLSRYGLLFHDDRGRRSVPSLLLLLLAHHVGGRRGARRSGWLLVYEFRGVVRGFGIVVVGAVISGRRGALRFPRLFENLQLSFALLLRLEPLLGFELLPLILRPRVRCGDRLRAFSAIAVIVVTEKGEMVVEGEGVVVEGEMEPTFVEEAVEPTFAAAVVEPTVDTIVQPSPAPAKHYLASTSPDLRPPRRLTPRFFAPRVQSYRPVSTGQPSLPACDVPTQYHPEMIDTSSQPSPARQRSPHANTAAGLRRGSPPRTPPSFAPQFLSRLTASTERPSPSASDAAARGRRRLAELLNSCVVAAGEEVRTRQLLRFVVCRCYGVWRRGRKSVSWGE